MHPNAATIKKFYSCFQQLDGKGMAQCYHEEIVFSDPVFTKLAGVEAGSMWNMLCSQAQHFTLEFSDIEANDDTGSAYWEAKYVFSKTNRKVHNRISASFEFKDGKIVKHIDDFDFWKWSRMAIGPIGLLLGWSPIIKNAVRKQAAKSLQIYLQK